MGQRKISRVGIRTQDMDLYAGLQHMRLLAPTDCPFKSKKFTPINFAMINNHYFCIYYLNLVSEPHLKRQV